MADEGRTWASERKTEGDDITEVQLDGLVVLKIIKHCVESLPTLVAGSLLGLDVEHVLEVTNCFPLSHDTDEVSSHEYQMDMMKRLRKVNVDNNVAGWYQSAYLGTYCTKELISTQVEFQESFGTRAVLLIYDPISSTKGSLSLKAFRLSQEFMKAYREKKFSLESVEKCSLASSGIFEEVRIRIHNAHVFRALLLELSEGSDLDCDFDRLDLSADPFLERNLMLLMQQFEDLEEAQSQTEHWERKINQRRAQQAAWKAERAIENEARLKAGDDPLPDEDPANPLFKPLTNIKVDRLDSLLIAAQIGKYCDQVNKFAGQSFGKLFLAGSMHKE